MIKKNFSLKLFAFIFLFSLIFPFKSEKFISIFSKTSFAASANTALNPEVWENVENSENNKTSQSKKLETRNKKKSNKSKKKKEETSNLDIDEVESHNTWQDVAISMKKTFEKVKEHVDNSDYQEAYDMMNLAYFKYYEALGFEATVMNSISRKRVVKIESQFRRIKHTLLGNYESSGSDSLKKDIDKLSLAVYKDAMVLDGLADKKDPDDVALNAWKASTVAEVDQSRYNINSFVNAFLLLIREGLEAILVVVAIIAYLIKSGNKHLCKQVYIGCIAALVLSAVMAVALLNFVGGPASSGFARELLEGITMFIAVGVLFYVSNWMLSKADEIKWEQYIKSKVQKSLDTKDTRSLVFAAFLAVFREGAELILFYGAAFSDPKTNFAYVIAGFLAGTVVLVIVYILFRYFSVKLPLKPFFFFTSIFLFILCISFMGKGVVELAEAGIISGGTTIPAMRGFTIPDLGIYDRAETLLPQIILVIAAAWIIIANLRHSKEVEKNIQKDLLEKAEVNSETTPLSK